MTVDEPLLIISRPPRFWGSRFGVSFVAAVVVTIVSAVFTYLAETRQPAEPVVTVKGIMASKEDFFNDGEVQRLLRRHNLRVEITSRGSREVAYEVINQKTEQYDFAFPSGQPAADLIKNHRARTRAYQKVTNLFSSPIVLASYRAYAEGLVDEGVAAEQGNSGLYYSLDTAAFVALGEEGRTWDRLKDSTIRNGNRVLAHTPGVCRSNSGATYLGLVAFVKNGGNPPQTEADIDRLAQEIQPIIAATGMPESDMFETYVTPEGKSQGPIVVVYEHQFLSHQIEYRKRTGHADDDRVLLYPRQEFQTDPEFISLRPGPADRLARLLATDLKLRERMMRLGYRVFDPTGTVSSDQLNRFLSRQGLPVPYREETTRAFLPNLDLLESLIRKTGRCSQ
jgi:hypothetical protein